MKLIFALLVLLSAYAETAKSMVEIWLRSDTFAHGFLVVPASGYMIWRKRKNLALLPIETDFRGLILLSLLGAVWLMANSVNVSVIQQFSLIGMLIGLVWTLLGKAWLSEIAYPLAFLFFAVPFGEFLLKPMMDFTARFSVSMLRLTGIPVYQDGTYFNLPTGNWSVIAECSGLRYLIASIMLGCLYAYLNYVSWRRRLAFIAFSCFFPVIANGFRAYMTVMIGHFIGMQYAEGLAHIVYGWFFFSLVMFILFWIGSFWSEPAPENRETNPQNRSLLEMTEACSKPFFLISLFLIMLWPAWALHIQKDSNTLSEISLSIMPKALYPWHKTEDLTSWTPSYQGADFQQKAFYSDGNRSVGIFLNVYRMQRPGHELIESQNRLIPQDHPVWKMPEEKKISLRLKDQSIDVLQARLLSYQQNLLVWRLNWVGGRFTVNDYWAKLLEISDKLLGFKRAEAGIILMTAFDEDAKLPAEVLQAFIETMWPSIVASLNELNRHDGSLTPALSQRERVIQSVRCATFTVKHE